MKTNALSIANYFIDKAGEHNKKVRPLKLMKLVYIAYGYGLAMLNRSLIDPRFDKVEAWKYGPVIPSVYHSFKSYKNTPVTAKTVVMESDDKGCITFVEPQLSDTYAKALCDYVWKRYNDYSDSDLVTLLHGKGTPWAFVYEEGKNNSIPEFLTQRYYTRLVNHLLSIADNERQ